MSEIKIKIGAELDVASVQGEVQRLVKQLESEAKFKVGADVKSAKDQLGSIKKEYEGMKDLQIKTTVQDGELTKVVARYKELDGTAKSIQHTMNKKTGMFEASKIDSTVKSMEKIDGLTNKEIQSRTKLISFEKQLNSLKEKSYKIKDKGSDEYKKAEADIQRLTATTKQYQGSLESVSKTKLNDLNGQIKEVDKNTDQLWKTQQRVNKEQFDFNKVGGQMESAGRGIMAVTAPVVAFGVASVKASTDFESSFAGVRKTVDATEQEFTQLSDGFREMSKTMPQSASNLAEIGEIAGQLGIEVPNIQSFTKTIADMAVTTDMTSQEAGTSMAKFANIMGTSQGDFDRLGSSIVDLGNNLSTSEKPILEMGLGLAGVAKQVGMTEGSTLGLAGALSSVGIGAERGASSVSKALINMQLATETGGESLEQFAQVAGMSGEQFTQAFKDDAGGAFVSFIKGLKSIEEDGGSVIATLDEMGISEIRLRDTLIRATNASDLFSDSMSRGNSAFNENVALSNEANQRYETTASKLEMMRNRVTDVAISLGGALAPSVIDIADKIANVVEKFGALDVSTQASIVKFGAFGMVAGTSLNVLGKGVRNFGAISGVLETIAGGFGGVSKGVEGASTSVSAFTELGNLISKPYVIGAVAIVGAIALISKAWSNHKKEVEATATRQDEFFRDYETNSKKNAEGIEYLRENGAEYDTLTAKMGANKDVAKLTTSELARYNELVKNMDGFGILNGQLDEHGNMIADTTSGYRDLIKAMEETQAIADRKIVSDFNSQKDRINKEIKDITHGGDYGATKRRVEQIQMMLDGKVKVGSDLEIEIDPISGKSIPITIEDEEKLQLELTDKKVKLDDINIELEAKYDKVKEALGARLSEALRDVEIDDGAKDRFKTLFDDLIEIDPTTATANGEKIVLAFAETMDSLQKEMELTGSFSASPLRSFAMELESFGLGTDVITKQIGEMGFALKGQEGNIDLINTAMSEFSSTGVLTEGTVKSLSEAFEGAGISTKMSSSEIISAIANYDQFALSLMQSEEAFEGLSHAQQQANSNINLENDGVEKSLSNITKARESAVEEASKLSDGMVKALEGLKGEGIIPDNMLDELIANVIKGKTEIEDNINNIQLDGFNEVIKQSLNDDGSFGKYTQSIIDEIEKVNGIELENKEGTWTVVGEGFQDVEENVQALNGIWQENPETKEYEFIEMGAEDVERAVTALNGVFVQNKETKEFEFVETGADGVITQAEAVKMGWEWNPETKEFISKEDGSTVVIDGTNGMKTAWSYDPVTKTFVSKITGVRDVVTGVQRAKEAWESMKSDTKNFVMNFKRTDTITTRNVTTQETLYGPRRKYTGTKSFASGTESFSPNGYASGTPTSSGMGMAYVAELGQELLVYPNNDIALTGHKPELRNIPRGTQIFNHNDTRALLSGEATLPIEDFDYNNMKSGAMVNQAVKSGQSVPSFAKGNTKPKTAKQLESEKKKTEKEASDEAKRQRQQMKDFGIYKELESQLDRLDHKLKLLAHREELLFNDKDIIRSQEWQIKFYKQKQQLVHETAEALRDERSKLQRDLSGHGFTFGGEGDTLFVKNLQHVKGKTKEVEEALNRLYEINDKEIPKQQDLFYQFAKSIKDVTTELDRYIQHDMIAKELDNAKTIHNYKEALLKTDREIIESKKQGIEIERQIQAQAHARANALRDEAREIKKTLDESKVDGLEFKDGQFYASDAVIDDITVFNGQVLKLGELAERYNEIQLKDIFDEQSKWRDSEKNIRDGLDAIEELIRGKIDVLKGLQDELDDFDFLGKVAELDKELEETKFSITISSILLETESYDKTILLLKDKLDLFHSDDFHNRMETTADLFEASSNRTEQLRNEMQRLQSITPTTSAQASELASAMSNVQSQMRASYGETKEYQRLLDRIRFDGITKPFEDSMKALNMELGLLDNNLSLIKDGVLIEDMGLDMLMPIPDFSDVFNTQASENDSFYNEQLSHEENIQALKSQSLELQLQEAERFHDEEMRKLVEHNNEMLDKIAKAKEELAELEGLYTEEQIKEIKEVNKKINDIIDENNKLVEEKIEEHDEKIEDEKERHHEELIEKLVLEWVDPEEEIITTHHNEIEGLTDLFLNTIESNYASTWGNIVGIVQGAMSSVMSAITKAQNAITKMQSMASSKGSSGRGNNTGANANWYAKGTDYHEGGLAVVSDGNGSNVRELLIYPDGSYELSGNKGAELRNLPRGTEVISNENTEKILKDNDVPHYANGTKRSWDFEPTADIVESNYNNRKDAYEKWKEKSGSDVAWEDTDIGSRWEDIMDKEPERQANNPKNWDYGDSSSNSNSSNSRDDYYDNYSSSSSNNNSYSGGGVSYPSVGNSPPMTKREPTADELHRDKSRGSFAVSMSKEMKVLYDEYLKAREIVLKDIESGQLSLVESLSLKSLLDNGDAKAIEEWKSEIVKSLGDGVEFDFLGESIKDIELDIQKLKELKVTSKKEHTDDDIFNVLFATMDEAFDTKNFKNYEGINKEDIKDYIHDLVKKGDDSDVSARWILREIQNLKNSPDDSDFKKEISEKFAILNLKNSANSITSDDFFEALYKNIDSVHDVKSFANYKDMNQDDIKSNIKKLYDEGDSSDPVSSWILGQKEKIMNLINSDKLDDLKLEDVDLDVVLDLNSKIPEFSDEILDQIKEVEKSIFDKIKIEDIDINVDTESLKNEILEKIDNQLMEDAEIQSKARIDILEQQKANISKYRDELKSEYDKAFDSGNVDLAKEIHQRYNEEANNFNKVNQQINQAIKERYDVQFSLMEKLANRQKQEQKRLQKDLDLLDSFSSQSSSARLQYSERILQTEKNYQSSLIKSRDTLREQLQELKVGSYEWNVVNDKVDAFNDKIIDSRNQIANLTKNVASIEFEAQLSNIERQLFDGKTQKQANRELDAKIKDQGRYLKGLEKELEVDKLKMFIRQNDLSLSQEELSLLNSKDKIEKESFDRLSKQLTIRQLEQKLINLSNQKTIQQLKQQEDGSWDFEYVADQDAIDEASTQLKDSQLDLIRWEQDLQNTKDRNQISSKSEVIDDLRNIVQKALNGEYKTVEEFNKAIVDLNSELYEGLNDGTEGGTSNVTDIFESSLDSMRNSFSSYISQINSILSSLETKLDIEQDKGQNDDSEIKDAEDLKDVHQKSNEDRKNDLADIKKANQEIYEQELKHIDDTRNKRDELHEKELRQWEEKQVKYGELIETLKIMEHELVSIQEKALKGQYKSLEDFTKDMKKLGVILASDYQNAWDSIVNKQLDSNKTLKNAFNVLKSDYGSLSASIVIDSRAMADAIVSASNIVKRSIEMVVNEVKRLSIEAKTASEIAVESANIAKSAMESARASASSARAYASQAQASASSASSSASPVSVNIEASSFASGGYTGDFNSSKEGRLGILHEKERVLDKTQTRSFDELVSKLPSVLKDLKSIQLPHFDVSSLVANMSGKLSHIKDSVVENNYHIGSLELPNVTNDSGVENLISGLRAKTVQYSKRG